MVFSFKTIFDSLKISDPPKTLYYSKEETLEHQIGYSTEKNSVPNRVLRSHERCRTKSKIQFFYDFQNMFYCFG